MADKRKRSNNQPILYPTKLNIRLAFVYIILLMFPVFFVPVGWSVATIIAAFVGAVSAWVIGYIFGWANIYFRNNFLSNMLLKGLLYIHLVVYVLLLMLSVIVLYLRFLVFLFLVIPPIPLISVLLKWLLTLVVLIILVVIVLAITTSLVIGIGSTGENAAICHHRQGNIKRKHEDIADTRLSDENDAIDNLSIDRLAEPVLVNIKGKTIEAEFGTGRRGVWQ